MVEPHGCRDTAPILLAVGVAAPRRRRNQGVIGSAVDPAHPGTWRSDVKATCEDLVDPRPREVLWSSTV